MTRKDLGEVLRIERACFEQPYTREILEQELKIKAAQLWVATYRGKILAYIDYWLVADEIELVSIAVDPPYARRGVARKLMEQMMSFGHQHDVKALYLDVRAANRKAQSLYEKFGFERAGVRKRYYSDNQEDAIIMRKEI